MQPAKINYRMYQGSTFLQLYRWESETKVYVPITSITKAAPCVITTTTAHNLPVGWRFKVSGAGGMKEINSQEHYVATSTQSNTITINSLNSLGFTAYTSGGVVEYGQPVSLTNYAARMQIRESVDSETVIHSATTENGQISLNLTDSVIKLEIPATTTAQFEFETAVYSMELYDSTTGVVVPFIAGNITLVPEVTR